ncbi:MAG: M48 family metalloprotease [Candidatus Omnitrophica bacterium]|nr:M48 family metalloprotease [Candidatus Omnitrophota bacterium]
MKAFVRIFKLLGYVCCFCSLTVGLLGCATIYNPATGKEEMVLVSTDDERAIGVKMARHIEGRLELDEDAFVQTRVKAIGEVLAAASDRRDLPYYFKVLKSEDVNAFTTPGAYVYLFRGLVDQADSDAELASVIAHEIGHIAARHAAKKMELEMGYNLVIALAFSRGSKRDLERYVNIGFDLISRGYSREDELFADKLAIRYLIQAGYDPYGMVSFMEKIDKIEREKGGVSLYLLRSHPYMSQRIYEAEKEIAFQLSKRGAR